MPNTDSIPEVPERIFCMAGEHEFPNTFHTGEPSVEACAPCARRRERWDRWQACQKEVTDIYKELVADGHYTPAERVAKVRKAMVKHGGALL